MGYKTGGAEQVLAMLKGAHKMFWGSFTQRKTVKSVSHIERGGGGAKKLPLFKRGVRKVLPCLGGGGGGGK